MARWIFIGLGGAVGSMLRYTMQSGFQALSSGGFPWGTLTINVLGCLLIGGLTGLFSDWPHVRAEYRLGLTSGLLGGFTTFSAFALETQQLLQAHAWRQAALYCTLSNLLGVLAVFLGLFLAGWCKTLQS